MVSIVTIVSMGCKIKMDITTIQLSKEMRDKISSFGMKGESYDVILKRIYALAVKEQLRQFFMDDEGFISIEDARKELDKKWPRSK
ncbi:MAG: hypothetical protein ABIH37_02915 [archaeon]